MTTAQKRQYVDEQYPHLLNDLEEMLEDSEYRTIDLESQKLDDRIALQYIITWLCYELIKFDLRQ